MLGTHISGEHYVAMKGHAIGHAIGLRSIRHSQMNPYDQVGKHSLRNASGVWPYVYVTFRLTPKTADPKL